MSGVPPAQWAYSSSFGGFFWYHAATDQILLQDGRRFPRPEAASIDMLLQICPQAAPVSPPANRANLASPPQISRNVSGQQSTSRLQSTSTGSRQLQQTQTHAQSTGRALSSTSSSNQAQNLNELTIDQQGSPSDPRRIPPSNDDAGRQAQSSSAPHAPAQHLDQAAVDQLIRQLGILDLQSAQRVVAADQIPQQQVQTMRDDHTGRYVSTWDSQSQVRTIRQVGPPMAIPTDPYLRNFNMFARQMLIGTEEEEERLFPLFRKPQHPSRFFTVGKVFLVLWVEPAGESVVTYLQAGETTGRFGERVYSKVRRFVVIRQQSGYCSALPVTTYGRRGVSKPGVIKSEHAIIYTGSQAPEPLSAELPQRGEAGLRSRPIRIDPDERDGRLDPLSRLDFGKITTIQHNLKVKSFGKVNRASMDALERQAQAVWEKVPETGSIPAASTVPSVSSGPGTVIRPPPPSTQASSSRARPGQRIRDSGIGFHDAHTDRRALQDLKDDDEDSINSDAEGETQEAEASPADPNVPSRVAATSPPARTAVPPPSAGVPRRISEQSTQPFTRTSVQPSVSTTIRRPSEQSVSYSVQALPRETARATTQNAQTPRSSTTRQTSIGSAGREERRPSANTSQGTSDQAARQPTRPSGAGTGSSRNATSGHGSRNSKPS